MIESASQVQSHIDIIKRSELNKSNVMIFTLSEKAKEGQSLASKLQAAKDKLNQVRSDLERRS